ncbi:hypothetical protein [Flavimaricola marinus]|uniref:Uncharacterized protein n=1 Tax=Flavimaricola marinus TaxID=1819565 RepID=A0A238LE66_9RHOB|nr:hypothetical protein [Flavimaricola marinus]SMY07921.1 hypothetical protein LOM8899_02066 [Flavimaricola marinus]
MWKIVGVSALVLGPMQANASQPLEERLIECAVMIEVLIGPDAPPRGEDLQTDIWRDFVDMMTTEAIRLGGQSYVEDVSMAKRNMWEAEWNEENFPPPLDVRMGLLSECVGVGDYLYRDNPPRLPSRS